MNLEDWMKRQLDNVYVSTLIMKESVYKRINGIPKKQDVYIFLGLNLKGYKKFIDVVVPTENTTGYWYNKINEFKAKGIDEFFMISMLKEEHLKKAFKMIYPNVIFMPSMIEFYNNSMPYILQKDHRVLMQKMQKIYTSKDIEEATNIYNLMLEEYKNNKLLLIAVNKYINDIMEVIKYPMEARKISSYTFSYLKMRAKLYSLIKDYKVFDSSDEIRKYICEFLKDEEETFKPSKRNWSLIINEMDGILTDKIRSML